MKLRPFQEKLILKGGPILAMRYAGTTDELPENCIAPVRRVKQDDYTYYVVSLPSFPVFPCKRDDVIEVVYDFIDPEPDAVTEDDRLMVVYFIQEKGDITRWGSWEERKPAISAAYPELIAALHNLEMAERTLALIVESVSNES